MDGLSSYGEARFMCNANSKLSGCETPHTTLRTCARSHTGTYGRDGRVKEISSLSHDLDLLRFDHVRFRQRNRQLAILSRALTLGASDNEGSLAIEGTFIVERVAAGGELREKEVHWEL